MNVGLMVTLLVGGLGIGGVVGYVVGLDQGKKDSIISTPAVASAGTEEQLFYLNDKVYKLSDLPSELQTRYYDRKHESFGQLEGMLKEFSLRLALAQEKNPNVKMEEVPPLQEILDKPAIAEAELKKFFEENKDRLPPNTSFEQIKPRLEQFLVNQKSAEVFQDKWKEYANAGKIKLLIKEPAAPLVSIPQEKFPAKGAETAKYTLVEVSDYLCPHCRSVHGQVKEALKEYGDKVKFVQINFSLRPQLLSGSIIQGGYCAQKESTDAFWKYHNTAFEEEWGKMNDGADAEVPVNIAKKAGIDAEKIKACVGSEEAVKWVEEAREVASSVGVSGTPTFFFNNRRLHMHHGQELATVIKEQIAAAENTGT